MKIPIYQIDAFADRIFAGNPAAVCPLEAWLPDEQLQAIAAENNLSETAFYVAEGDAYQLRWFTPVAEVDLCGHATLATAYVLFEYENIEGNAVRFLSKSGPLSVVREGEWLTLDFPVRPPAPSPEPEGMAAALGVSPEAVFSSLDYMVVLADEAAVQQLAPDFKALRSLDLRGVMVTARGDSVDFVSRFFAPKLGVDEDPVTGSAHCVLTPYWSARLGQSVLTARQLSKRGGYLRCELQGDRVLISGQAVPYLEGTIRI